MVVQKSKTLSARRIRGLRPKLKRVWQSGFYDHRLRGDEDLCRQALYIQQNPVRRSLVVPDGRYEFAWSLYLA
jgi:putative transposase